jgi:ubiquinone/menaquinone biosynthesis C-methylase UbiE
VGSAFNSVAELVNLYDGAYRNYIVDTYQQVRVETYGADLGQTSWATKEESAEIPRLLGLTTDSVVLEVGCGSGAYALHIAANVACRIVGLDINASGIQNANELARARRLDGRASFKQCDVSLKLAFERDTFHAVFANDVLCHIPTRSSLLEEMCRVLKPGGLMLFSDALVVGGMLSHEEIATRSSIGFYVFSAPGENERLIHRAGFSLITATDTTEAAASIAGRWHDARERYKVELIQAEGSKTFEGLQRFLQCAHSLMKERRLLRFLYVARKER